MQIEEYQRRGNKIMFKSIKKTKEVREITAIVCDICKKEYKIEDVFEIQEFYHVSFEAGWGSVFGDGNRIECDICQHCLKKILGENYRIHD